MLAIPVQSGWAVVQSDNATKERLQGPGSNRRPGPSPPGSHSSAFYCRSSASEKGVRLAQKFQAGPCIPVGIQLEKAEVGPTSGPTRRGALSHGRPSGSGRRPCAPWRTWRTSASGRGRPAAAPRSACRRMAALPRSPRREAF
jgi:hypothetical protein